MEIAEKEKMGFMNLIIIVLSIYVLLALVLDTFLKLPGEISNLLLLMDKKDYHLNKSQAPERT